MVYMQAGALVAALGYLLYKTWFLVPLRIERGRNSDDFTTNTFIDMVNRARGLMLVCDDGNDMPGSIYGSPKVVSAVKAKLASDPEFGMHCMFSSDFRSLFRTEFDSDKLLRPDQVRRGRDAQNDPLQDHQRRARRVRCRSTWKADRERQYTIYRNLIGPARTQVLGSYMDEINEVFEHAA